MIVLNILGNSERRIYNFIKKTNGNVHNDKNVDYNIYKEQNVDIYHQNISVTAPLVSSKTRNKKMWLSHMVRSYLFLMKFSCGSNFNTKS